MNSWSNDIESILRNIQKNCNTLCEYHRQNYYSLNSCIKYFKIPIIILSAVNSVFGVMMTRFTSQTVVSVFTSIVSLLVGVIGSVELFLGVNEKLTKELSSQKDTYALGISISKMLALERDNRHIEGLVFLDDSFNTYQKIINESNIKNNYIADNLLRVNMSDTVSIDIPSRPAERSQHSCI